MVCKVLAESFKLGVKKSHFLVEKISTLFFSTSYFKISCILFSLSISPLALAQENTQSESTQSESSVRNSSENDSTSAAEKTASSNIVIDESEDVEPIWQGKFGPFKIGAMVSAELPSLVHFSLETRMFRYFGTSAGFGGLKSSDSNVSLKTAHWDVRLRYFPFSGSLYLGLGLGNQKVTGEITEKIAILQQSSNVELKAEVDRFNVTPMLGWHWIWNSGFNMNFALGYQFAPKSKITFGWETNGQTKAEKDAIENTDTYKKAKKNVSDAIDRIGGMPLPYVGLGLGWMI